MEGDRHRQTTGRCGEGGAFPDLGLSIGVEPLSGAHDTVEVVRRADECMYAAKNGGGNRLVVFAAQDVE